MALTVYANAAQYGNFTQSEIPDRIDVLLKAATFVVAKAANRDPYSDTPTVADAVVLADATCAQVAFWVQNGIDPNSGGLDARVKTESKIGSGSVKYDTLSAQQIAEATGEVCSQVRDILQSAGLLWLPMPVGADVCDPLPSYGLGYPTGMPWWWRNL